MWKNMKIFLFLKLLLTQGWNSTLKHGSFLNVVNYVLQLIPSCRTFKNRFVATPTLMKIKWKRELVHNGSMLICQTMVAFVPCKNDITISTLWLQRIQRDKPLKTFIFLRLFPYIKVKLFKWKMFFFSHCDLCMYHEMLYVRGLNLYSILW